MSAISNNQSVRGWQKNDTGATFSSDPWRVQCQCQPNTTFVVSESDRICTRLSLQPTLAQLDSTPAQHAVPVVANPPLAESYIRQNDFVTIYPEQSPLTFGFQVYYCVKQPVNDLLVIELWLSVQTSTLESHPQLRLSFEPVTENHQPAPLQETAPGQILSADLTRGLIVHPLDVADCTWLNNSDSIRVGATNSRKPELLAFGGFMEKGVIRRMRLQLVHSRQKIASHHWQQLVESFANSPLPLTA
ncbi:MAG: hypothetical protein MUC43_04790 [Pirellula sp.]|nr:hypothetical protein [Pirellula sp.]